MPSKKRYCRELRGMTGLALSTVQDELRKLSVLGVILSWKDHGRRFYGANRAYPLFSELVRIVRACEQMPAVKHSQLQRPTYARHTRKRRGKIAHLPTIRQPHWGLFSAQEILTEWSPPSRIRSCLNRFTRADAPRRRPFSSVRRSHACKFAWSKGWRDQAGLEHCAGPRRDRACASQNYVAAYAD